MRRIAHRRDRQRCFEVVPREHEVCRPRSAESESSTEGHHGRYAELLRRDRFIRRVVQLEVSVRMKTTRWCGLTGLLIVRFTLRRIHDTQHLVETERSFHLVRPQGFHL
jgi:hypothetical protein